MTELCTDSSLAYRLANESDCMGSIDYIFTEISARFFFKFLNLQDRKSGKSETSGRCPPGVMAEKSSGRLK